jgi:hypothetical protein
MQLRWVWAGLLVGGGISGLGAAALAAACEAMTFIPGVINPEDMVRVPGTPWIIASGLAEGERTDGHIYLVNAGDQSVSTLLPGHVTYRADANTYPACPGKPDEAKFSAHGLSLSRGLGETRTLYVVHHGDRESVEVFELDARPPTPQLTWLGCVVYPAGVSGNGVAALPGGAFAATNFMDTQDPKSAAKMLAGEPTGGVLIWHPNHGWRSLPGAASISADNGIEASADGKQLFVAGWGDQTVVRLPVGGTGHRDVIKTGFHTDNLRWGPDGYLYAAGQRDSLQNLFKCAPNTDKRCDSPYSVLQIDPRTLQAREVVHDAGRPEFGAASVALKVGDNFWLGTPHGDRIAIAPTGSGIRRGRISADAADPACPAQAALFNTLLGHVTYRADASTYPACHGDREWFHLQSCKKPR